MATKPSTPKWSSAATARSSPAGRALRLAAEYWVPIDEEWDQFIGHFERRKVALGDCGRS
jgi:hypothetical protein